MITYDALEDSIVARLAPLVTNGFEVEALPDTPKKQTEAFAKGRVTVMYRSSEFSKNIVRGIPDLFSTDIVIQEEYAMVDVVFEARTLRGPNGVHAMSADTRLLLLGFTPDNWSKMYLESNKFLSHDVVAGLFTYVCTFIVATRVVELPDDENLVLLTQVILNTEAQ